MNNLYETFYKGKSIQVQAKTTLEARDLAQAYFKNKHGYDISVVLVAKSDGTQVIHKPLM